jgi:signal peptidase
MSRGRVYGVGRTLVGLTLVGGLLVATILAVPSAVGAEASYVVLSDSMSPSIEAGDVVVVRSAPADAIDENDVITFTDADNPDTTERTDRITHRVVEVRQGDDGPLFVTKGDANEDRDPQPVPPERVVGVVWFHIPLVGYLVSFTQSSYGLVAFVVVPGVLLVVSELHALYRDAVVVDDGTVEAPDTASGESPTEAESEFEWGVSETDGSSGDQP